MLDLTLALAGPFATFLLAGLGARVIKIENPASPDHCRENAPFIGRNGVSLGRSAPDDVSAAALNRLRGKYAVTLNLKQPGSREVFADLVRQADVVVENFAPGTLDRLGIGYEFARARNPRIVYCSISGYGADHSTTGSGKAMDSIVQALSGLMMTSGAPDDPPVRVGVPFADLCAPVFAVVGILAALRQRDVTGRRSARRRLDARRADVARRGGALRLARGVRRTAAHRTHGAAADAIRRLRVGRRLSRNLRADGPIRARRLLGHRAAPSSSTIRALRRATRESPTRKPSTARSRPSRGVGRRPSSCRCSSGTACPRRRSARRPMPSRDPRVLARGETVRARASGARARRRPDRARRADSLLGYRARRDAAGTRGRSRQCARVWEVARLQRRHHRAAARRREHLRRTMSASAIDELRAAFEEPFWALGREPASDRETVVMSWPSVPVELVRAAGFSPVFARGRSTPTPAADRVLEPDLFPNRLRQLVEAALTDRLADVAAIVLPRSSDPDYKCFLYLRELVRRGIAANLPPVLLFDLLHSDDSEARAYNSDRARDLSARLARPCGSAASSGGPAQCDRERQSRARRGEAPPRPAQRSTAHRRAPTRCRCSARSGSSSPSATPRSRMRQQTH